MHAGNFKTMRSLLMLSLLTVLLLQCKPAHHLVHHLPGEYAANYMEPPTLLLTAEGAFRFCLYRCFEGNCCTDGVWHREGSMLVLTAHLELDPEHRIVKYRIHADHLEPVQPAGDWKMIPKPKE
jgi:hypothetical protein